MLFSFSKKIGFGITCKYVSLGDNLHEMSAFFWKIRKNTDLSFAEIFTQHAKC